MVTTGPTAAIANPRSALTAMTAETDRRNGKTATVAARTASAASTTPRRFPVRSAYRPASTPPGALTSEARAADTPSAGAPAPIRTR